MYKSDSEAKREICEYGLQVYQRGFVASNDGNISVKVGDNEIWATPTGVSKGALNPDMLIKLDLDGNVLSRSEYKPSSEIKMHLRVYKEDPDVTAVVHAHPIVSTAFSILGETIVPDILAEPMFMVGTIHVADFGLPGSYEVPESVAKYVFNNNVALLANHGALAWGKDLKEAFFRMDSLEHFMKIYLISKYIIRQYNPIPDGKADVIAGNREKFRAIKREAARQAREGK